MMSITGAIILFAVFWFLILLMVLPVGLKTQGESGEVVPGTHASAPAEAHILRKVAITTALASVLWVIAAAVIFSGAISVRDLDFFGRMDLGPTAR